jgi:hypothetical protein
LSSTRISRHSIGRDAADYIRRQLSAGGVLSSELISVDGPIVDVWAFLPEPAQRSRILSFSEAGVRGGRESRQALANYIAEYLTRRRDNCAVFEDALSRAGDPALAKGTVPYITCEEQVLHYLCGSGHGREDAERLVLTAKTYRLVGVLSRASAIHPSQAVDRGLVKELAEAADDVIIGAWDGDAELIWSLSRTRT